MPTTSRGSRWAFGRGAAALLIVGATLSTMACRDDRAGSSTSDTGPADAADPRLEVFTRPDAISDGAPCAMAFFAAGRTDQGDPIFTCDISTRSTTGCDDMAHCVCRAMLELGVSEEPAFDVELCTFSMVVPRGAVTLADYCALSGSTAEVPSLVELYDTLGFVDDMGWVLAGDDYRVELGETCDEVAAFTTWGEPHAWNLSLGRADEPFPESAWSVEEYPLETPPIVTLDEVASFDAASAVLVLTEVGRERVRERLGDGGDLVGRGFLVHTAEHRLDAGILMSLVISSTREGIVVVLEELERVDYAELRFDLGYPSQGPASFDALANAMLAAEGKLLDAACISSCGCPDGRACHDGRCAALPDGCQRDTDCCLGGCGADGVCR